MSSMKEREEAFERMFVRDEELKFKAVSRRNRLLGLWAAEKLGKSGVAAEEYAKEVIRADLKEPGHEDVFQKIRKDFDAANVDASDETIRNRMVELLAEAVEQVKSE
ncbi:DUF1476 domain-containing protein [Chelativorans sp. Marseille-P2723]|uniref:DUF1476 domain-containing protein n=1 Tax=Chelativorans sp. Marseille-P2723 TaxID=2709133 RepID=UPI00156F7009|nr:DUF1476 domain-containing protein [Chelativorans sp. Marseille-P2723]